MDLCHKVEQGSTGHLHMHLHALRPQGQNTVNRNTHQSTMCMGLVSQSVGKCTVAGEARGGGPTWHVVDHGMG